MFLTFQTKLFPFQLSIPVWECCFAYCSVCFPLCVCIEYMFMDQRRVLRQRKVWAKLFDFQSESTILGQIVLKQKFQQNFLREFSIFLLSNFELQIDLNITRLYLYNFKYFTHHIIYIQIIKKISFVLFKIKKFLKRD